MMRSGLVATPIHMHMTEHEVTHDWRQYVDYRPVVVEDRISHLREEG
jgi:hypothetical protein